MSDVRRVLSTLLLVTIGLTLVVGCSSSDDETTITIGALLPMSGALSSYGETSKAALEDAASSFDDIDLVIKDTETNPQKALAMLQEMHNEGITVVVGPYSSSEVQAVGSFADQNGIILISPLSTARSLALPGDNVFRFTPDDAAEGLAAAALAYEDGVRTIITFSRNDAGNLGLQSSFKTEFEKLGGQIVTGVTYPAAETDFTDEVAIIAGLISQNGDNVGVYLTAFAEVTSLFGAATDGNAEVLLSVPWYGSDSVALSRDLVEDAKAAAFAVEAGYPNPILGLRDEDSSLWKPVSDRLAARLGRTPDSFALAAYDALNIAYKVMQNAGDKDTVSREAELLSLTNSTTGLTGPLRLNESGDRAIGIYDFWSVCPASSGSGFTWVRTDTYDGTRAASAESC